jgi:hypothetical protein
MSDVKIAERWKEHYEKDFAYTPRGVKRKMIEELSAAEAERDNLRVDLYEYREVVTANNFAEMQRRAESAEAQVQQLREALETYAVRMSYDYPSDVPIECGYWCDLCHEHVDAGKGHKPDCLLAATAPKEQPK